MYKKIFFHSLTAGVLSALAAIIYNRIYFFSTMADFSKILNTGSLIGLNMAICLLAGFLFWAIQRLLKKRGEPAFNFLFSILSFAAVIIPISATLPLDIQFPELFPGLAVPMVFFPAIAWYTARPLFAYQ
ncbi:MAG: hypothetical protein SFU87_18685 [Chitinophagaceae bacterium]|nr:hypothetical protein [Chitinophagaceae bacterium]